MANRKPNRPGTFIKMKVNGGTAYYPILEGQVIHKNGTTHDVAETLIYDKKMIRELGVSGKERK